MIHLENINKTYHNGAPLHVLKGINLDIERGEFVGSVIILGDLTICHKSVSLRYATQTSRL